MATIPASHIADAQLLEADGYVHLWRIQLRNNAGNVYLTDGRTIVFQGITYNATAIKLGPIKQSSEDEVSRPTLTIANPENIYASFIAQDILEKSLVIRKRILRTNLEANANIFEQRTWYIGRVTSYLRGTVTVELRNLLDGPTFMIPARQYLPPDFPVVSLG